MSGDHNQYQKNKSYLDGMDRYKQVRELVKDPSLRIKDIVELTGYDKGHVSRLRKASQQFECPRCGHCCLSLVDAYDTSQEQQEYERGFIDGMQHQMQLSVKINKEPTKIFGPGLEEILNSAGFYRKREWVGLTEEEREFLLHQALRFYDTNAQLLSFIKTVEEKLKEKNT